MASPTVGPRLLFAGNFHWNAGSSHVIAEYACVAGSVGCEIGVSTQLSRMDSTVPAHLPLVDDIGWATHLLLVFEGRQFLSPPQQELCGRVPRHRRFIIDPDAHLAAPLQVGEDTSAGTYTHQSWLDLYAALADRVLQPTLGSSPVSTVTAFPYFGVPPIQRLAVDAPGPEEQRYGLQYVGSNWWRWEALTTVISAAQQARPGLDRIRVCGRWWDGQTCPGHEAASNSEPGWLRRRGIDVAGSVPFGQVVATMSEAAVTPVLARPLLARRQLLTPRMFETPASGSVPLIAADLAYLTEIYGDDAAALLLTDGAETIARLVRDYRRYQQLATAIQHRVHAAFSYDRVLTELLKIVTESG